MLPVMQKLEAPQKDSNAKGELRKWKKKLKKLTIIKLIKVKK